MLFARLLSRRQSTLETVAKAKRGTAAVEFALLAAPFLFMVVGLIEISLLYITASILDHAAGEAARQIRTGQVQQRGDDAAAFRTLVCDEIAAVARCDSDLRIDVRTFSSFAAADFAPPIDPDTGLFAETENFIAGGPNQIVVVRVFYEWNMATPGMGALLGNMAGGRRLVQSTVVFRNEPF